MHGSPQSRYGTSPSGIRLSRFVYGALLIAGALALAADPRLPQFSAHLPAVAVLAALNVAGYFVTCHLQQRLGRSFDLSVAVAIVGLVTAGPLAALLVALAPDVAHLIRRRHAFWNIGLVANIVSWLAVAVIGNVGLGLVRVGLPLRGADVLIVGLVMVSVNFVCARLLIGVLREGAPAAQLIRREFVALLPLELAVVTCGAACALLVGSLGELALLGFIVIASVPQLAAAQLLRAPSVAKLPVDDAATIYRDALADELRFARPDRRLVHLVDALVQRRPLPEAPPNPLDTMQDALLVMICTERPPTQRHFTASPRAQVILVARAWAQLTARCTPALSHPEALTELRRSGLAQDAPLALAAAGRIIEREDALTEHVAGVPQLHRAPLPWQVRHELLPVALGRLAA